MSEAIYGRTFDSVPLHRNERPSIRPDDPDALRVFMERAGVVESQWRWQDSQGAPSLDQSFWLQLPSFMRAPSVAGLEWIGWIVGAFSGRGLGEFAPELWIDGAEFYMPAIDASTAHMGSSNRPWVAFRLNAAACQAIKLTIAADRMDTEHDIDTLCLIGVPQQHYSPELLRVELGELLRRAALYDGVLLIVDQYGGEVRVWGSEALCDAVASAFSAHQEVDRTQN